MSTITLNVSDVEVSEALVEEIDSITVSTNETGRDVSYAPQAFTREGATD